MSEVVLNPRRIFRIALCCLIVLSSMFALTCRMSMSEEPPEALSDPNTLRLIRNVAINNIPMVSNEEERAILERSPQLGQYKMAGSFGQYGWRWDLPTGRSVVVSFTGNINHIEVDKLQVAVLVSRR